MGSRHNLILSHSEEMEAMLSIRSIFILTALLLVCLLTSCGEDRTVAGSDSSAKQLIITADDLGLTTGVNRGIIEAIQNGVVTDVSIMAGVLATQEAIDLAREYGLKVGVHLNLTVQVHEERTGKPVLSTSEVPSLVDEDGYFFKKEQLRDRLLWARVDFDEVRAEYRAQMAIMCQAGLDVVHVNTDQGMHNEFPQIFKIVKEIAKEYDIPMRSPNPLFAPTLEHQGIWTTGYLESRYYDEPEDRKLEALIELIEDLKPGITEIIVHPAIADDETRAITAGAAKREAELKALTSAEVREAIARENVELISFERLLHAQRE